MVISNVYRPLTIQFSATLPIKSEASHTKDESDWLAKPLRTSEANAAFEISVSNIGKNSGLYLGSKHVGAGAGISFATSPEVKVLTAKDKGKPVDVDTESLELGQQAQDAKKDIKAGNPFAIIVAQPDNQTPKILYSKEFALRRQFPWIHRPLTAPGIWGTLVTGKDYDKVAADKTAQPGIVYYVSKTKPIADPQAETPAGDETEPPNDTHVKRTAERWENGKKTTPEKS